MKVFSRLPRRLLRPGRALATSLAAVALAAGAVAACSSTDVPVTGIIYTDLYVDPSTFKGGVPCGDGPGSMRSYVVTLFDVTDVLDGGVPNEPVDAGPAATCGNHGDPPGLQQGSTIPVSCTLRALMALVVPGRAYVASVDAYALPACDSTVASGCLRPLGGAGSGSRIMVDDNGTAATPIGATCCGRTFDDAASTIDGGVISERDGPSLAIGTLQVPIRGCQPLTAVSTASVVTLDTAPLTASLGCSSDTSPAGVSSLLVSSAGNGDVSVACGAETTLSASVGQELSISVYALSATGSPSWGTVCYATPLAGAAVDATCAPLSTTGQLRIDPGALAAAGLACPAGATVSAVSTAGASGTTGALPCGSPLALSNLPAGSRSALVTITASDGTTTSATCQGNVTPGHVTAATCG